MNVEATLDVFARWLLSWGASPNTIRARLAVISAGAREWGPLETVTTESLADWLAHPSRASWTRVTYFNHVRSFFGWLADSGRLPVDPSAALRRPRTPQDRPRPLTEEQAAMALAAATGNLHTWLTLGLYAGLRAHEIAKVSGEDVGSNGLYVVGKGQVAATLPVHPAIAAKQSEHPTSGWWFPARTGSGHVAAGSVSTLTTRLFSSLGIEGSIHRCRHTYGTRLIRSGANLRVVQTLMRHSSLATTARYCAVDEQERMAAIAAL